MYVINVFEPRNLRADEVITNVNEELIIGPVCVKVGHLHK